MERVGDRPVGDLIKELRTRRGLSQSKLASLIQVDRAYINNLESGRRRGVSLTTARRLASALGVQLNVFETNHVVLPENLDALFPEDDSQRPVPVPILEEGTREEEVVDHVFWSQSKVAGRRIVGIELTGDSIEPHAGPGDTLFADTDLSPGDRDIVVCVMDDRLEVKRYREDYGKAWLESKYGYWDISQCEIRGVVIKKEQTLK